MTAPAPQPPARAERTRAAILAAAERFSRMGWSLFEQGRASGELEPLHDDPFHAASALIGATVFYVPALVPLLPPGDFDPLAPEQVRPTSATRCAPRGACSASERPGACHDR